MVLSRPPQVDPDGRAESRRSIGADQGAIQVHVAVPSQPGGEQRTVHARRGRGEHVDGFVQVAVGGRGAELVVGGELGDPGAVEEPAQHQHGVAVTPQRAPALPRPAPGPLTSE